MFVMSLVYIIVPVLLVIAAAIYRKVTYWKSNIPSLGLLWFRQSSGHTCDDLKDFCERNKAKLVQGWIVAKTDNLLASLLDAKSHVFAVHPDTVQIILKDDETFAKQAEGFGDAEELMCDSLISSNGPEYRIQKDIMAPAFHYNYIKQFVPIFVGKAQELFNIWKAKGGKDIALRPELSRFTLDTLGLAAFNIDFNTLRGGGHGYVKAYGYLMSVDLTAKKDKNKLVQVRQEISKMTADIIAAKEKSGSKAEHDFLDRLLTGKDKLTQTEIRNNVFLIFLAGQETTTGALTWALYFMAQYPEYQRTARDEVDEELRGATPDAENVKSLTFVDMFIKEVLRNRSANFASREATKDVYVGDYFIPKGTRVGTSSYTIHHLEEFWPEPYKFDPYRFTPENSAGRHPFAYLPFSLGRRMCIGNNFSLLEQKIFLAMLLQQFTIEKSEQCAKPIASWRAVLPTGIKVSVVPRQKAC